MGWNHSDRNRRHQIIGFLQKSLIRSIVRRLNPRCHSHCHAYLTELKKIGIPCSRLRLFGNIPVVSTNTVGVFIDCQKNFAVFGGMHESTLTESFLSELHRLQNSERFTSTFHFLGRNGPGLDQWKRLCNRLGQKVLIHGVQTETRISEILSNCRYGIGTTPQQLVQKSGSVATMIEHGLLVICTGNGLKSSSDNDMYIPKGAVGYIPGELSRILGSSRPVATNTLPDIADEFLMFCAGS